MLALLLLPAAARAQPITREILAGLEGHTKAELVEKIGPPADTVATVDGERLLYEKIDAGHFGGRSGGDSRAGGADDFNRSRAYDFSCRIEVVIRDGRVRAFNQSGSDCR